MCYADSISFNELCIYYNFTTSNKYQLIVKNAIIFSYFKYLDIHFRDNSSVIRSYIISFLQNKVGVTRHFYIDLPHLTTFEWDTTWLASAIKLPEILPKLN